MNKQIVAIATHTPFVRSMHGCLVMILLVGAFAVQGDEIALWDFEGGVAGEEVTLAADSISGLNAVAYGGAIKYVTHDGAGVAVDFAASGLLKVDDPAGIFGVGFTNIDITLDVNMNDDAVGTTALIRNGLRSVPFSLYIQDHNKLSFHIVGAKGDLKVVAENALSATAGWQQISIQWADSKLLLYIDGELRDFALRDIGPLVESDVNILGIGGLVRSAGNTGQYFNGAIDHVVINDKAVAP